MERVDVVAAWVERRLVWFVVVLGVLGIALAGLSRAVTDAGGVNVALALLVASVGLGIDPDDALPPRNLIGRCALVLLAGAVLLPALAWIASRLVDGSALRGGVLAAGVAPAEVASVAIVAISGGQAPAAMAILIGSTVISVLTAGPVLSLLAPGAGAHPGSILIGLTVVIAIPFTVGIGDRFLVRRHAAPARISRLASVLMVLLLVWLVAGQITLSTAYLRVALALLIFLLASTGLGWVLSARLHRCARLALMLPTGMRDFAIAAGIAIQAFGPRAAAPLGIYGLMVLLLGASATAGRARAAR
jgi:predicted Na+-dependent transporter